MKTVLIAGCGNVGTSLGKRLVQSNCRVLGLRRDTARLPAEFEPLAIDLSRPFSLPELPARLAGVVFLPSSRRDVELYKQTRVNGFRNLYDALYQAACDVARWIYVSSTSVYGENEGEWVDEDTAPTPESQTAQVLRQGEMLMESLGLPGTTVRFGGIYGPGRLMYLRRVARGDECTPGLWTNRIHVEDCARMLQHLLELDKPERCYIGVDHEPVLQCRLMGRLAEMLRQPYDSPHEAAAYTGKRLSNRRIVATGFTFNYPTYESGYARLAEDFLLSQQT